MEDDDNVIGATFEIWNRRKYPIVVRHMTVHWFGAKALAHSPVDASAVPYWQTTKDDGLDAEVNDVIEPNRRG